MKFGNLVLKLKKKFSEQKWYKIDKFFRDILAYFVQNNLDKLSKIYKSDKYGLHFYTQHYENHFKNYKNKNINLIEIGIGGFDGNYCGGSSLKMWKKYFKKGKIFGIDIYDKSFLNEKRIKTFKGSQVDFLFLKDILEQIKTVDIIIDDGSHINEHVIESFKFLFPYLKLGGLYVIEDTQTSYWEEFGGDSVNLKNEKTLINFFKNLIDNLNYEEFRNKDYIPSYYDMNVVSIHFYHNLIFIYKNINNEGSNKNLNLKSN